MSIAICGTEAFYVDAIEGRGGCMICGRVDIPLKHGWVGTLCSICGREWSHDSPQGTVRLRRENLGLTRSEMALRTGLARSTIRYYEMVWPSKRYFDKTLRMVKRELREKP